MRETKKGIIAALTLLLALSGCGGKVKINNNTLRLELGHEETLKVSAADREKLRFSSMDPEIATVDEDGVVKGISNGITVISVAAGNSSDNVGVVVGNGVSEYVDETGNTVSVLSAQPVDEAMITGESDITALELSLVGGGSVDVSIGRERTYEVKVTKTPADSADKVTLRIADPSVARIEGKTLIGVSKGKTTLTASAPNGVTTEMIVRVK